MATSDLERNYVIKSKFWQATIKAWIENKDKLDILKQDHIKKERY